MLFLRVLLALSALACFALPAAAQNAGSADDPVQAVYLAWYGEPGAEWTYVFVESTDGFERLDEWRGIHIAHGDHIWQVDTQSYWRNTVDCRCVFDNPEAEFDETPDSCRFRTLDQQPTLRSLADDTIVELIRPIEDSSNYEYGQVFEVLGSIGPRLFIRHGTYGYACGAAHGDSTAAFSVFDLRSQSGWALEEVLEGNDELADAIESTRDIAYTAMQDHGLLDDDAPGLEATMLFPTFVGESVGWMVQWTGGACYACSDHLWSAYTISHRVRLSEDVDVLDAPNRVPRALRALAEDMTHHVIRGWSRIEPSSAMNPLRLTDEGGTLQPRSAEEPTVDSVHPR